MNQTQYKTLIKQKVRDAAYMEFKDQQAGHEKGRLLEHDNLSKPKGYLLTNLPTNKQASLLYNLRCQTVSGIRDDFHRRYQGIKCQLCMLEIDSQSHILQCAVIKIQLSEYSSLPYHFIHGNLDGQVAITLLYSSLLEVRDRPLNLGAGLSGPQ